ncbi:hypothetical protein P872_07905 [Rhodonellum psychrophilum GCM71 = DSM 17998]|uniref:Polymerase beta nucleotidyltransferase domain-containing protein n=2 Tax=Rhodonellum TaxID=336827 RepID=U5BWI6_9BACT|nr:MULTISPECIES: nucleotidyltransferase domain-containing protein [Rhodonellum]ERM81909.1 hypothetical protein P872_07905 [Rhodonellum psychrophilum GCM71 = DSM 17998]SDZ49268.1 hypothetical protein SAMN05444412_11767 [Rhodonellum ikkaensis]
MKDLAINSQKIEKLCKQHHVERLHLFGSALGDSFNQDSDVDFLVKFEDMEPSGYFENFLTLKEKLSELVNRDIDLVEEQTLKNPILIASINKNKKLIYGQQDQ